MGRASVEPAKFPDNSQDVLGLDEDVIMVGKQAPGYCALCVRLQGLEQNFRKLAYPLGREANVRSVFVTGSCDVKMRVKEIRTMRRSVPGPMKLFAPIQNFHSLFGCELSPQISWSLHVCRMH